jgi:hypothetical protein
VTYIKSQMCCSVLVTQFSTRDTVQYRWHRSVLVTQFSIRDTVQWSWHNSVLMRQFSTRDTVQYSWHGSALVTQFSTRDTVQYRWHRSVLVTQFSTSDILNLTPWISHYCCCTTVGTLSLTTTRSHFRHSFKWHIPDTKHSQRRDTFRAVFTFLTAN